MKMHLREQLHSDAGAVAVGQVLPADDGGAANSEGRASHGMAQNAER